MKYFLFVCFFLASLTAISQRKNLIVEADFDSTISPKFTENNMFYPYSATIVKTPKRSGSSLKVELRKNENIRAEYGVHPKLGPKESWYGFSIFLPSTFEVDKNPASFVQWHAYPDQGEAWRSPPMFLGVMGNNFIIDQRTDTLKISTPTSQTFKRTVLGAATKSKWNDFVVHTKWSHKSDGLVEIWMNDKLILTKEGANCYNDLLNPYFKIGIYKWDFATSLIQTKSRVIYVDEVRIGNEKAIYNDVYPGKKLIRTVKYYYDGTSEEL